MPTAPAFLSTPRQPTWAKNRPFVLQPDHACIAKPPLPYSEAVDSPFYRQAEEVYNTVRLLTLEPRMVALYWTDDVERMVTPPGHSLAIATEGLPLHPKAFLHI